MRCKNVIQSKNTSIELYKIILNTYLFPFFQAFAVVRVTQRAIPFIYSALVRISSALVEISSELVEISSELVLSISELLKISVFIRTTASVYRLQVSCSQNALQLIIRFYFIRTIVKTDACSRAFEQPTGGISAQQIFSGDSHINLLCGKGRISYPQHLLDWHEIV